MNGFLTGEIAQLSEEMKSSVRECSNRMSPFERLFFDELVPFSWNLPLENIQYCTFLIKYQSADNEKVYD